MGVSPAAEQEGAKRVGELGVRVLWIALRLILVYWLAEPGQSFIYQAF